jgi:ApbE superfamily uncharacterized protein (UPF0280 family)
MTGALAALLPDGRLHLQHGPIDCICRAWGAEAELQAANEQAAAAFGDVLTTLVAELPLLRTPLPSRQPEGPVARRMHEAVTPFADQFITPMAAVAGAVADHVLEAMTRGRRLTRAFVNDGGDIAYYLAPGETLRAGMVADLATPALDGVFVLDASMPARGLATSGRACKGRGGRSFSFGVADAVSVLARSAARADAAATVIGNAVNLPGHPAVMRRPASEIDPDSDLGARLITWDVGTLTRTEIDTALDAGRRVADALLAAGLIEGAVLALRGEVVVRSLSIPALERS